MKIQRISVSGFRGLPDRSFDFVSPATSRVADLVLVTGGPSTGKTSLLTAILAAKEHVAPYGIPRSPGEYLRHGEASAKVRLDWLFTAEECARTGLSRPDVAMEALLPSPMTDSRNDPALIELLSKYDPSPKIGKVEYFHEGRRLIDSAVPALGSASLPEARNRLTTDDAKYAFASYLAEVYLGFHDAPDAKEGARRINEFVAAFGRVTKTKEFGGVDKTARGVLALFRDPRVGRFFTSRELSGSERQALLFALTFVRSGINDSVVLIDGLEQGVGDSAARAFLDGVRELGVGNQIIATTSSRALLAEPPRDAAVIRLDEVA